MRTRFAPSPTGLLHIGGLRTALYTYLLTRQQHGMFILRIEDTDQARTVEGAVENILKTLEWAGLHPDEGVVLSSGKVSQVGDKGPYIQSERFDLYREHVQKLIESGYAYYAFDTVEELEQMRREQQAAGVAAPKYDLFVRMRMKNSLTLGEEGASRLLKGGEPYVVRLKVSERETIACFDKVRGNVSVQSKEVDDTVLLKSDGFPTYHLANVVDDHLMEIDFVLRGEEWLPSLPKHVLLYRAFGWNPPAFAHVPLLLNKDKTKLSKRQADVAVEDYIEQGYVKEALLNFVALLGWNPGSTKELFSLEELIKEFSIDRIQKSGAVFDREKLDWLQGQWMRKFSLAEFSEKVRPIVAEKYVAAADDPDFAMKAALIQDRITFFHEAPEMLGFFYEEPELNIELILNEKQGVTKENIQRIFDVLITALESIQPDENWQAKRLESVLVDRSIHEGTMKSKSDAIELENVVSKRALLWALRATLTGRSFSPGVFEVAAVLGKEATVARLHSAQKVVS